MELMTQFGTNTTTNILSFQRLEQVQGWHESVRDYTTDIYQQIRNAGISDERYKHAWFYRGLLPPIKSQIFFSRPETEKYAEIAEQNMVRKWICGPTHTIKKPRASSINHADVNIV